MKIYVQDRKSKELVELKKCGHEIVESVCRKSLELLEKLAKKELKSAIKTKKKTKKLIKKRTKK